MSLDHQLQPLDPAVARPADYDRVNAYYSRLFGWSVKWRGPRPFLALENGICAVTLPKLSTEPLLARLAATGCEGPAMAWATQRGRRVALLAEIEGLVPSRDTLPTGVEVLAWGALLPLPTGSQRTDAATEWLQAPNPHQRWLPSLDAVLAAARTSER